MELKKIKKGAIPFLELPGTIYHYMKRRTLKNKTPTILSNNCFGTFIYHDMGLKFNSPTINLCFTIDDFIKLVNNLPEYMESDVYEVKNDISSFPIGKISYNGEDVIIQFMHYTNFEQAREKWNERKQRIDYDNIFIIINSPEVSDDVICKFEQIPYENKLLITNKNYNCSTNIITHDIFNENYKWGGYCNINIGFR